MSEKAILSTMAECFGIENRDTILKIALECTEGKDREKIVNFYDGFDASIKRDIAAIKEHGIDYYVNVHAKAYINAGFEPEKTQMFIRQLAEQVVWGLDDDFKDLLKDLFSAIKFNHIYVNKKQFVILALEVAGREPVKYMQGLTEEYIRRIRKEMVFENINIQEMQKVFNSSIVGTPELAKVTTPYYSNAAKSVQTREHCIIIVKGEIVTAKEKGGAENTMLEVGLNLIKPMSMKDVENELSLSEHYVKIYKKQFIDYMKTEHKLDVEPFFNQSKKTLKKT